MRDEELKLQQAGVQGTIIHQPIGPILAIFPWNYPFWLPFKSIIPPMILGNSIMLKHSPQTPLCALALKEAFTEAGFGKGEYQNMFVTEDQCKKIIADRRVRAVKFTGSTTAGKNIAVECAKNVKKVSLELGGNDPFVVLKDADIEKAVDAAYDSRMACNAQACINAKRFIVSTTVYDEFKQRLIEKIKKTTVIGDPMDRKVNLGPLVSKAQKLKLQEQVEQAVHQGGATITYGTHTDFKMKDKALENGHYFSPVVLEEMNPEAPIYNEEFFGPVFNLFRVDSSKEALDLANKSDYGLSSAIFTKDLEKAEAAA